MKTNLRTIWRLLRSDGTPRGDCPPPPPFPPLIHVLHPQVPPLCEPSERHLPTCSMWKSSQYSCPGVSSPSAAGGEVRESSSTPRIRRAKPSYVLSGEHCTRTPLSMPSTASASRSTSPRITKPNRTDP